MSDTSKSPWSRPQDAEPQPEAQPQPEPTPRIAGLNYAGPVFPAPDDSDWHEGLVQGFEENVDRLIRTGRPGPGVAEAFDKMMRHDHAEMNRESRKLITGTTREQIENPEFWRGLQPCREAFVDVGLFGLDYSHYDDVITVSARFPEDMRVDGFCVAETSCEALVKSIKSELVEWANIHRRGH